MIRIYDGRDKFYQWDIDQKVVVEDEIAKEVHFTNAVTKEALVCEVYIEDGKKVADVPNILLQTDWDIKAYAACDLCVRAAATFMVAARAKPADYVYTETEVKNYDSLEERVAELEKGGAAANVPVATTDTLGIVMGNPAMGTRISPNGEVQIQRASSEEIRLRTNTSNPIVPCNLKYAVTSVGDECYALKSQIPNMSKYALKSEIPDVSQYQTAEDVAAAINEALGVIENGTY